MDLALTRVGWDQGHFEPKGDHLPAFRKTHSLLSGQETDGAGQKQGDQVGSSCITQVSRCTGTGREEVVGGDRLSPWRAERMSRRG